MSKELTELSSDIEKVLMGGDLAPLNSAQRVEYHNSMCRTMGLNPASKPFEYIRLNGKLTLYATKACTEQLRRIYGVSLRVVDRQTVDGIYIVTARAMTKDGREDESTGAVSIGRASGDELANAMMKAETKAKRRVTLSICGLGMLDESELETTTQHKGFGEDRKTSEVPSQLEQDTVLVIPAGEFAGQDVEDLKLAECEQLFNDWISRSQVSGKKPEGVYKQILDRLWERMDHDQTADS